MNAKWVAVLTVFSLLHAAPQVRAQCADWQVGPLDDGSAPNGANGGVAASTVWDPDGDGPKEAMLVVAGFFSSIEGVPANYIAARDPATGWQPLGSGTNDAVSALTVFNGELIAGGYFTLAGGQPTSHIARWNGSSWQPLGSGTDNWVGCLTVLNGELIAGGAFILAGAQPANGIARWNGTSWQPLGSGTNDTVYGLTAYGGELIAGGYFTLAGGQPASHIARWNGSLWQPLGTGTSNAVHTLTVFNGDLIAGGYFTFAGGQAASHIARWDGSSWHPLRSGTDDNVIGLTTYNNELYAGGQFTHADGQPADHIAHWNGASWQPAGNGTNLAARVLIAYGGDLVAGGDFTYTGGLDFVAANYIARWNGFTWGPFGGGRVGAVNAMITFGSRVIAGGAFQQSTGVGALANDVVAWNGLELSALGEGMDDQVTALKAFKYPGVSGANELIAGGFFTHAGTVTANYIARWDETGIAFPPPQWEAMGSGFNSIVYAIERFGGRTYAGGTFTLSGSTPVNRIARWNEVTDTWEALGSGMNGIVLALKEYNGYLYAGGLFTTAGGVSTGGLARWNGSTWSQVGGFFGPNGNVWALEVHNGVLVMAGLFAGFSGSPNISTWNGTSYSNLGTGGTNAGVRSLRSAGARLYVGGEFATAGGLPANHVAYWDGAWHELAGGADNYVVALAWYHDEIHLGGSFKNVRNGAIPSPGWGKYRETGVPWIVQQPLSQSVPSGATVAFKVQGATGYGGLTGQWYRADLPLVNGATGTGSSISGAGAHVLVVSNVSPADVGFYHAVLSNGCGSVISSNAFLTVDGVTAVEASGSPEATVFEALGPNPSHGASRLAFSLAREATVQVRVHDVAGRRVRLMDAGRLPAGRHELMWDGRGSEGRPVCTGLYFVALEVAGRKAGVRRLVIQR